MTDVEKIARLEALLEGERGLGWDQYAMWKAVEILCGEKRAVAFIKWAIRLVAVEGREDGA